MQKIKWILNPGFGPDCDTEGEFEVEDNATDDEIEELAKEAAFDCIDWSWWKADAEDDN